MDFRKITEVLATAKAVQYVMIAALLTGAFFLPRLAVKQETDALRQTETAGVRQSKDRQQNGGTTQAGDRISENTAAMQQSVEHNQTKEDAMRQAAEKNQANAGITGRQKNSSSHADTEEDFVESRGNTDTAKQEENITATKGTIVLDPGHGGDDPGMIGASGINEKKLNLVYAKKLQALLEAEGYRVVLTRETEEGLYDADAAHKKAQDMQRRIAIIAQEAPLITVSIHQNSYQDPAVSGPQVFYYEHSAEGEKLAKSIQDSMNSELSEARPRVEKSNASYYILKRSQGTTVIVECGFLSNPEEETRLQEEAYQDRVCEAVCEGILQYLDEDPDESKIL